MKTSDRCPVFQPNPSAMTIQKVFPRLHKSASGALSQILLMTAWIFTKVKWLEIFFKKSQVFIITSWFICSPFIYMIAQCCVARWGLFRMGKTGFLSSCVRTYWHKLLPVALQWTVLCECTKCYLTNRLDTHKKPECLTWNQLPAHEWQAEQLNQWVFEHPYSLLSQLTELFFYYFRKI